MTEDEVVKEFANAGALLEGHFVLTSGLHSPRYLQCARVMMDAGRGQRLCQALAKKISKQGIVGIDLVVSPALGGIIVGHEMGRQLGVPAIFVERVDGRFTLRRGFDIPPGAHCLMVEDVVTTGLSSRECLETIRAQAGAPVAAACLVDRSGGTADLGVPLVPLARLDIETFEPDLVPEWLAAIPVQKPGSRSPA